MYSHYGKMSIRWTIYNEYTMEVSFRKRATNYRALLRKMAYKDIWYNEYTMDYLQWLQSRCSIGYVHCL